MDLELGETCNSQTRLSKDDFNTKQNLVVILVHGLVGSKALLAVSHNKYIYNCFIGFRIF